MAGWFAALMCGWTGHCGLSGILPIQRGCLEFAGMTIFAQRSNENFPSFFRRGARTAGWFAALMCILFLITPLVSFAQLRSDTARGIVGEKIFLPVLYSGEEKNFFLKGKFLLSNPTVFYPEKILSEENFLSKEKIIRHNDSLYEFSFSAEKKNFSSDTLAVIEGIALAGNDSVCEIKFFDVKIDTNSAENFFGKIISQSLVSSLYVRFARLEQNVPNPAPRHSEIYWAYRIDKVSDLSFHFYDICGKEIFVEEFQNIPFGNHKYFLTPKREIFPPGVYWVRMVTNSGESSLPMVIVE